MMQNKSHFHIGLKLEKIAANFLKKNGLIILQHNFYCKFGEIDLICLHNRELIFVEVRYRKQLKYGTPQETITFAKKRKLLLSAQCYLTKHKLDNADCRFDVIAISGDPPNFHIEWIENAIYNNKN